MALQFPLSLDDFFAGLAIPEMTLEPTDTVITSRTRGGEVLTASIGNTLWRGEVALRPYYHGAQDAIRAKLAALRWPDASFMIGPKHRRGPILDPDGAGLDGHSPQIATINANNRELRIKGMPDGYRLSPGDYLSFTYGSPARHSFHQIVTGAVGTAGSSGWIEVRPHIPRGAAPDDPVRLVNPQFKAVLDAAPGYGSIVPIVIDGMGFSFIQTLR